ncbi:MAG: type II toxin-antitoxin system Y4mF family antitoxin [Erysipelotrichaceae bacterium]
MNNIAKVIKEKRKENKLTQKEFSMRSGLGLRFIRELEQGKTTLRMDKVNQALEMFGLTVIAGEMEENEQEL